MIEELSVEFAVRECCEALSVSRSGYYQWKESGQGQRAKENAELMEQIQEVFAANKGRYGSPRVTEQLRQEGFSV